MGFIFAPVAAPLLNLGKFVKLYYLGINTYQLVNVSIN